MSEQSIEIEASAPATLITLAALKDRLGIQGSEKDLILDEQGEVVTDLIRDYTGRLLNELSIVAIFRDVPRDYVTLPNPPIVSVASVTVDGVSVADLKFNKLTGRLWSESRSLSGREIIATYTAGFDPLPAALRDVYARLVKTRIDASGAASGAGGSIKSVTVFDSHSITYNDTASGIAGGAAGEMAEFSEILDKYVAPGSRLA